jgi:transcriptional regulator with XRE-family HTH domain
LGEGQVNSLSKKSGNKSKKVERLPPGTPSPVDIHVGNRVRLRRILLGISQGKLGGMIGLTFQQIQKYERGANRIGASRLYELAGILEVPVEFFFEGIPKELETHEGRFSAGLRDADQGVHETDALARRETLELVRAYYTISDPKIRKMLFAMIKACEASDY